MDAQWLQAIVQSLLNQQTGDPAVLFARKLGQKLLGVPTSREALRPIFTHMNGEHPGFFLDGRVQDGVLRMPVTDSAGLPDPGQQLRQLEAALTAVGQEAQQLELLLDTLEQYGSRIPVAEDISEYDYRRMVAALAVCAAQATGELNEKENLFLLYTADFSGIQKFIYTVYTAGALKSLRSRSFFLELAMEHYIDELLTACGLSRVNLLYSGGGHCYLLLPNTRQVLDTITDWNTRFNNWLAQNFGSSLYLADGYTPCCGNDLTNTPGSEAPYQAMFRRVSRAVSRRKLCRYSPDQLRMMNRREDTREQRECRTCGTQIRLRLDIEGKPVCRWCYLFEVLSNRILQSNFYVVREGIADGFQIPGFTGEVTFCFCSQEEAELIPKKEIRRVYCKNRMVTTLPHSIRMFVGDYAARQQTQLLAKASQGASRLGICRMDVDNLGHSFVAGFEKPEGDPEQRQRYVTLIRTGAFSRQISLFFKYYINQILSGEFEGKPALEVMVVYSGGDDVFLAGAWTDIIEAALRIRNAFRRYTCGALTISAGIGMFHPAHPIRLAANQTAILEEDAKSLPEKDGVSIFAPEQNCAYTWQVFEEQVLREKMACLQTYFQKMEIRGSGIVYHILGLLRQADAYTGKSLPLARFAYYLARLAPPKNTPAAELFDTFSKTLYQWALEPEDRRQLATAICLYLYQSRKVRDLNVGL